VIRTAKAVRGPLQNTIRLAGSVTAAHYADLGVPVMQAPDSGRNLVLTHLATSGSQVQEGAVVAQIDGQAVEEHLDDVDAQLAQLELELRRFMANQDAEMESVRQRVRVARGDLEKAQQDINAAEVKNKVTQELLKLALEEAQAAYEEARQQLPLVAERQAIAMRLQEITRDAQIRHRNRHRVDLSRFTVRTPISGTVILQIIRRNQEQVQVRVGDQVSPGQTFLRVVDLAALRVDTMVNQAESEHVRIGQKATIRFDAYPDIKLPGRVFSTGMMATGGRRSNYYIRRVPVRIVIEGKDPRVLPDLTASADVVVSEETDRILVPRQAVVEERGKSVVFVKEAGVFTPREVELGNANNTEVAVVSGLQEGEEVALDRPL
jgi:multidrug resistance efflux pump